MFSEKIVENVPLKRNNIIWAGTFLVLGIYILPMFVPESSVNLGKLIIPTKLEGTITNLNEERKTKPVLTYISNVERKEFTITDQELIKELYKEIEKEKTLKNICMFQYLNFKRTDKSSDKSYWMVADTIGENNLFELRVGKGYVEGFELYPNGYLVITQYQNRESERYLIKLSQGLTQKLLKEINVI